MRKALTVHTVIESHINNHWAHVYTDEGDDHNGVHWGAEMNGPIRTTIAAAKRDAARAKKLLQAALDAAEKGDAK